MENDIIRYRRNRWKIHGKRYFRSMSKFSKMFDLSFFIVFGGLDPCFLDLSFLLEDFSFRVQACTHICTSRKKMLTENELSNICQNLEPPVTGQHSHWRGGSRSNSWRDLKKQNNRNIKQLKIRKINNNFEKHFRNQMMISFRTFENIKINDDF